MTIIPNVTVFTVLAYQGKSWSPIHTPFNLHSDAERFARASRMFFDNVTITATNPTTTEHTQA